MSEPRRKKVKSETENSFIPIAKEPFNVPWDPLSMKNRNTIDDWIRKYIENSEELLKCSFFEKKLIWYIYTHTHTQIHIK